MVFYNYTKPENYLFPQITTFYYQLFYLSSHKRNLDNSDPGRLISQHKEPNARNVTPQQGIVQMTGTHLACCSLVLIVILNYSLP